MKLSRFFTQRTKAEQTITTYKTCTYLTLDLAADQFQVRTYNKSLTLCSVVLCFYVCSLHIEWCQAWPYKYISDKRTEYTLLPTYFRRARTAHCQYVVSSSFLGAPSTWRGALLRWGSRGRALPAELPLAQRRCPSYICMIWPNGHNVI